MGSLVNHVMTVLERIAPLRLAEKWDKVSRAQTCVGDWVTVRELKARSLRSDSSWVSIPYMEP